MDNPQEPRRLSSIAVAVVSFVLIALLAGSAGFVIGQHYLEEPAPSDAYQVATKKNVDDEKEPTSTPVASSTVANNTFDIGKVKVGDKLGAMTVKSFGKLTTDGTLGALPLEQNFAITFTGTVEVTGSYTYYEPGINDSQICMHDFDAASATKLPTPAETPSMGKLSNFCFTNQDLAQSKITNTVGATGKITVVIDELTIGRVPADGGNDTAHLVRVVQ